ncbi:MAG: maleylpyruvate isomerase family mycothiol-dependent enzyme [Actinomycetota bacterium]|nr:maleylpyruvate isomerase family mycothiol-dependent enzyme [Actinomycetota bacterium]
MAVETIRQERLLLVERLRALSESQWDEPSLCAGWTIRHVLAHLVTPFSVSAPAMALAVSRHRSIGRAMDSAAQRLATQRTPEELLSVLEAKAGSTFRPPGMPLEAPLTDVVCHGADIRWALGEPVADWSDPARLRPVLDFLTGPRARAGFVPAGRLRGLALVATDQQWRRGQGVEVRGPSLALAMAMLGRDAALTVLSGEGVVLLAQPGGVRGGS